MWTSVSSFALFDLLHPTFYSYFYLIQCLRFTFEKCFIFCVSSFLCSLALGKVLSMVRKNGMRSWLSFMMDNSKVRCLKCNTRGVPAHGAVSEEGSRRYSPVLLCVIGCRCGILCAFYRLEIGCIWGTLWAEPCDCLQEPRRQKKKKKTAVPYKYLNGATFIYMPPPLSWLIYHEGGTEAGILCATTLQQKREIAL